VTVSVAFGVPFEGIAFVSMLNRVIDRLNENLKATVDDGNELHADSKVTFTFTFVDVADEIDGHGLCATGEWWMNGTVTSGNDHISWYHPNQRGHDAVGRVVAKAVKLKEPTALDLRAVDWTKVTVPASFCRRERMSTCPRYVGAVSYQQGYLVVTGRDGTITPLGAITARCRAGGGYHSLVGEVMISDGKIVANEQYYRSETPREGLQAQPPQSGHAPRQFRATGDGGNLAARLVALSVWRSARVRSVRTICNSYRRNRHRYTRCRIDLLLSVRADPASQRWSIHSRLV
jgi:hypothetical protein